MTIFLSVFPIALLIYLMTKRHSVPASKALPIVAAVLYAIRFFVFKDNPAELHAGIISGVLSAWTPILVIWGAILLFQTLEVSGALKTIRDWLGTLAEHRVEQIMLVGWAFSFFIEGVSGFGTPAALAAPILVGFGFNPLRAVILCLVLNSVPVSFGAVGTPTWFGLGTLGLSADELLVIGERTAIIHFFAGLVIPFLALRFLLSWQEIRKNWIFILLSILSCTIPYLFLATWNIEFPSIIGGAVGLITTLLLAKYNIGLMRDNINPSRKKFEVKKLLLAFSPLMFVVGILILTRVESLGLKSILTSAVPSWNIFREGMGTFFISPSLVIGLENIFGTAQSWSHAVLYVPSVLPFLVVTLITFSFLKVKTSDRREVFSSSWERIKSPIIALSAALIFVKLLMVGASSPAMILGENLARVSGTAWGFFSPLLGALGAFFSGSNTVSNLTFGGIQQAAAVSLQMPPLIVLSLQNVGGAMGNMVSIQNIIAACAVVGIANKAGEILKKTIWPMLVYAVIAGLFGLLWTT